MTKGPRSLLADRSLRADRAVQATLQGPRERLDSSSFLLLRRGFRIDKRPGKRIRRIGGLKPVAFRFEEHTTAVQPLGSIQTDSDIEQLAQKVAELVGGQG